MLNWNEETLTCDECPYWKIDDEGHGYCEPGYCYYANEVL